MAGTMEQNKSCEFVYSSVMCSKFQPGQGFDHQTPNVGPIRLSENVTPSTFLSHCTCFGQQSLLHVVGQEDGWFILFPFPVFIFIAIEQNSAEACERIRP